LICVPWAAFAILLVLAALGVFFVGFVLHTWFLLH
jgi:hypothetical protein